MLFEIGKILQFPTQPVAMVLLLLLTCLYLLRTNRLIALKRTLWFTFALLFACSLPIVTHYLILPLESKFPTLKTSDYPEADAIVILGGSVAKTHGPRLEAEEIFGTRLFAGAKLFQAHKAPRIVVSGGVPYQGSDGTRRTESKDMKEILIGMQIPDSAILEESDSRNTKENAIYTRKVLSPFSPKHILLVTSGVHLPRAYHWFSQLGYKVTPVPSEHRGFFGDFGITAFVPNAGSLLGTTYTIKEYLGLLVSGSL